MSAPTYAPLPLSVLRRTDITHGAKCALARLGLYAWKTGEAYPSLATLAADIGASRRMVINYLRELRAAGLVQVVEQGGGNRQHTTRYTLTSETGCTGETGCTSETGCPVPVKPVALPLVKPVAHKERNRSKEVSKDSPSEQNRDFFQSFFVGFKATFATEYQHQKADFVQLARWRKQNPEATPESFGATCRRVWADPYHRKAWLTVRGICADWSSAVASLTTTNRNQPGQPRPTTPEDHANGF